MFHPEDSNFTNISDAEKAYEERKAAIEDMRLKRIEEFKLREFRARQARVEREKQDYDKYLAEQKLIKEFKPAQTIMDDLKTALETDTDVQNRIFRKISYSGPGRVEIAGNNWNTGFSSVHGFPQSLIDNKINTDMIVEDFPYFWSTTRDITSGPFNGWYITGKRTPLSIFTYGLKITLKRKPRWWFF